MRKLRTLPGSFVCCALVSIANFFVIQSAASETTYQTQTPSRQLQRQTETVKALPSKAKRWALVVGVDQYRDGQINALKGSVNDAHNLANALVRYAGYGASASFMRNSKGFLIVTGAGFGGTDAKVIANGKDVSAQIVQQSNNGIRLDGTKQQLNILSGKNEVVVRVGDKSTEPYIWTQIIK